MELNQLVFKLCIQYQLTDTLLIVAGDCGFGFEKKEYYEQIVRRNAKRMNKTTIGLCLCEAIMIILLISMAQCSTSNASLLFPIIPFYKFVIIPSLCRWSYLYWPYLSHNEWNRNKYRVHSNESQENDISRNLYWQNEVPVYDPNKMNAIPASFLIDTVVTHIPHLHIVNYSPKTTLANGL